MFNRDNYKNTRQTRLREAKAVYQKIADELRSARRSAG